MLYNQTNQWNGIPMPLLMGYIPPEPVQEVENEMPFIYDPVSQTVAFDMRMLGTKCLKTSTTTKKTPRGTSNTTDRKNEIDDSKSVK